MAKRGYHGTSIQMIADKVGITKAAVLHHFESKEGILLAILEHPVPEIIEGVKTIVEDESMNGLEKLASFLRFHMDQVAKKTDVMDLMLREFKHLSPTKRKVFQDSQREYAKIVVAIIDQMQRENTASFEGLKPKIIANAVLGMCNWTTTWLRSMHDADINQITKTYTKMMTGT